MHNVVLHILPSGRDGNLYERAFGLSAGRTFKTLKVWQGVCGPSAAVTNCILTDASGHRPARKVSAHGHRILRDVNLAVPFGSYNCGRTTESLQ